MNANPRTGSGRIPRWSFGPTVRVGDSWSGVASLVAR